MTTQDFLLGTYTRKESKGIYGITLDREKEELGGLSLIAEVDNPTYLDTSKAGTLLFSVLKEGQDSGGVVSYKEEKTDSFNQATVSAAEGAAPCYVAYDEKRQFLYTANYHKGEVALYRTTSEGGLSLLDTAFHKGSSTHPNQDAPHAHYFDRTPDGQYLIACDLGTDEVLIYEEKNERLLLKNSYKAPAGTGPRHLVFHPTLNIVYVIGELSCEVLSLRYSPEDGSLKLDQTISMLPNDYTGENSGAAIRISSDGNFLYASNRGHNSIVVYAIDANGALQTIQYEKTLGSNPRDFNLDETEKFVIAGHQNTPHLTLFKRDPDTGKLSVVQKEVYAPEVVCVRGLLTDA